MNDKSIIKFIGRKEWNTTVIMTGVHWNERSGLAAFQKILPEIKIDRWIVYFITANLQALEKNIRFVEKNMNRCFRKKIKWNSYEENRTREIRKILNKSDYLLDVHNTTNKISEPFLIWEEVKFRKYFPVQKFLSGIDPIQQWWSDWYMLNIWKVWFCLESGSIYDPNWPINAEKSIINFLKLTGNIEGKAEILADNQKHIACKKMYKCKTNNFKLSRKFKDFDEVKKWEIIWIDGWKKVVAKEDWLVLFAHDWDQIGKECFVFCVYE